MTVRHLRPVAVRPSNANAAGSSDPGLSGNVAAVTADNPGADHPARHHDRRAQLAGGQHAATVALARELYLGRRRRGRHLSADLFGEPTWDILLDLYAATREGRRVPTTSACIGADVPPTTALRWLRILESRGLVAREDDGRDGRRTFVYLTPRGLAAMDSFLSGSLAALRRIAGEFPDEGEGGSTPFIIAAE